MTFISGSLWWFFTSFFEWSFLVRTLATFDLHNILPDGCYLLLPFPETSGIFRIWKNEWLEVGILVLYIYIYIHSLGYFGLFSGVNSLAVSFREEPRNLRWRILQEYSFLSPGGYRLVPWGANFRVLGKLICCLHFGPHFQGLFPATNSKKNTWKFRWLEEDSIVSFWDSLVIYKPCDFWGMWLFHQTFCLKWRNPKKPI